MAFASGLGLRARQDARTIRTVHFSRKSVNKAAPTSGTPVVALTDAQIRKGREDYEGRVGAASIDKRRYFLWAMVMTALSIVLAVGYWFVLPLKKIETHVIEVNRTTGEVRSGGIAAKSYEPGDPEKTYWLAKFASNLLEIDPRRDITEDRIQTAMSLVRGKAAVQATEYLRKTTPLKTVMEDPNFSRRVNVRAINFIRGTQTATVQIRVIDQTIGRPAESKNYIVRCDYAFVTPSDSKAIMDNPLGMFVIDFSINQDV